MMHVDYKLIVLAQREMVKVSILEGKDKGIKCQLYIYQYAMKKAQAVFDMRQAITAIRKTYRQYAEQG